MVINYFKASEKYAIGFVQYRNFITVELFDTYAAAKAELHYINGGK